MCVWLAVRVGLWVWLRVCDCEGETVCVWLAVRVGLWVGLRV